LKPVLMEIFYLNFILSLNGWRLYRKLISAMHANYAAATTPKFTKFGDIPCRVRDWKMYFDPTSIEREPSLVLVSMFCLYRKA